MAERELDGRIALVTGGSRGIGAAVCAELGAAGATVVVNYARDAAARRGGVRGGHGRRRHGPRGAGRHLHRRRRGRRWWRGVEADIGPIAILVNNAGITRDNLIMKLEEEDWRSVIDTNLGGAFFTCRAVARPMLKRRAGVIINMSSVVGVHGNAGQTNYSASKAGLIGLTKSLAKELGTRGIRVNAIAPGYIATELTDALPEAARDGHPGVDAAQTAGRPGGRGAGGAVPGVRCGVVHHR